MTSERSKLETVFEMVENNRDEMVKALIDMIKIQAISPSSDGDGEREKIEFLQKQNSKFQNSDWTKYIENRLEALNNQ